MRRRPVRGDPGGSPPRGGTAIAAAADAAATGAGGSRGVAPPGWHSHSGCRGCGGDRCGGSRGVAPRGWHSHSGCRGCGRPFVRGTRGVAPGWHSHNGCRGAAPGRPGATPAQILEQAEVELWIVVRQQMYRYGKLRACKPSRQPGRRDDVGDRWGLWSSSGRLTMANASSLDIRCCVTVRAWHQG